MRGTHANMKMTIYRRGEPGEGGGRGFGGPRGGQQKRRGIGRR